MNLWIVSKQYLAQYHSRIDKKTTFALIVFSNPLEIFIDKSNKKLKYETGTS